MCTNKLYIYIYTMASIVTVLSLQKSWQLIIKSINVPDIIKVSNDYIILDCDYDLENTSSKGLVVKWFFNTNQVVYQWIYGRHPLADEPAAKYIDLTYKASDDPYTEYRAMKLNKPGIDLTGEYTCVISTFEDERTANASMIVYYRPIRALYKHATRKDVLLDTTIYGHVSKESPPKINQTEIISINLYRAVINVNLYSILNSYYSEP
ncbi:hypothetical protein ACFW04_014137 [Cataglyphis niger]